MLKYLQLTRPRIVALVLFALVVAAWTSGETAPDWQHLVQTVLGMALVSAGAATLNQWYEQRSDALMARTQGRPIPSHRVSSGRALAFGVGLSLSGLIYLALLVTLPVALWAAASWAFYVVCYTPLKSRSAWQLPVGAVAGAMPMLVGGAVADALGGPRPWLLFTVLFLWQFPHAVAIGWIYREQYARAGLRVAAVVDPTGRLAARLAVAGAAVLLPVSLVPVACQHASPWFALVAGVTGAAYLVRSVQFGRERTDLRARQVLRTSFVYLPVVLVALLLTAVR